MLGEGLRASHCALVWFGCSREGEAGKNGLCEGLCLPKRLDSATPDSLLSLRRAPIPKIYHQNRRIGHTFLKA